jgi:hypothetical protein
MSQPKFNQQLSSTEFEVRLHSYTVIHPTTPPPPQTSQAGRLYNYTVTDLQGRQTVFTKIVLWPNFIVFQMEGFWIFFVSEFENNYGARPTLTLTSTDQL